MNVGDVVRIRNARIYGDVEVGDIGTIVSIGWTWEVQYQVRLINKSNPYSNKGFYYFDKDDIEKMPDDIPSMYPTTIFAENAPWDEIKSKLLNARCGKGATMKNKQLLKGYKIAEVCFANYKEVGQDVINKPNVDLSKDGCLYALYDNDIVEGDIVLCCTGHHGHVIGQVKNIFDIWSEDVKVEYGREIICKIDYSAFEERQAKLKRIDTIKKTMAKKKAELDELAVYELLAKQSPDMAKMLKELKELL